MNTDVHYSDTWLGRLAAGNLRLIKGRCPGRGRYGDHLIAGRPGLHGQNILCARGLNAGRAACKPAAAAPALAPAPAIIFGNTMTTKTPIVATP